MALTQLTKIDGGGISTTSDYRVGVITATKFVGPIEGAVTGTATTATLAVNAQGLTGTPDIVVGIITASSANFSGDVSIGGTLTYEDVTNIDSVGIVTARNGIDCNGDLDVDGHTNLDNVNIAGVATATGLLYANGGIQVENSSPSISLIDTNNNPDYIIGNSNGTFRVRGAQSGVDIFTILGTQTDFAGNVDCNAGLDVTGNTTVTGDLDVDGHTNLDNVSIAGVTTIASNTTIGGNLTVNGTNTILNTTTYVKGGEGAAGILAIYADEGDDNADKFRFISNTDGTLKLDNYAGGSWKTNIKAVGNAGVHLYNNNVEVAYTNNQGLYITNTGGDAFFRLLAPTGYHATIDMTADTHTNEDNYRIQVNTDQKFRVYGKPGGNYTSFIELDQAGRVTLTRDVDVARHLDVGGHTDLDNVSVAGVTTFSNNVHLLDNDELRIGGSNNSHDGMKLYHDGSNSHINDTGTGSLILDGSKIRLRLSGSTQLETDTNGIIATGTAHRFQSGTSGDCELIIEADTDNNNELDNPRILFRQDGGNDWSAIGTNDNVLEISNSVGSGGILFKTGGTNGYTNATGRWKIDTNGHLLPNTAGAVDIGSTTAEIGNVYIADDKRFYAGSDQNLSLHHNNSTGINYLVSNPGNMFYMSATNYFTDAAQSKIQAQFIHNSYCELRHAGNLKFRTSETGIDVTGEVKATQDYPNFRPTLDLNFAAVKKLDPRITYARTGPASFVNEFGKVVLVGDNVPRFDHDPVTKESKGLLIEESRTNFMKYSDEFAIDLGQTGGNWDAIGGESQWTRVSDTTETKDPTGLTNHASKLTHNSGNVLRGYWYSGAADGAVSKTFSVYLKKATTDATNVTIDIGDTSSTTFALTDEWKRFSVTTSSAGNGNFVDFGATHSKAFYAWGAQMEAGAFATSYIPTSSAAVTRGADQTYIDGDDFLDFYNQTEGTMISSHSILPNIPSTHNLYTYQIAPTGNTAYAPLRILDKNSSIANSIAVASVYNNGYSFLTTDTGNPVTVAGRKYVIAVSIKKDDYDAVFDGGDLLSDSSGDLYTADHISIGYYKPSPQAYLNGHIQRLTYYPFKLTDNQLKTVTS